MPGAVLFLMVLRALPAIEIGNFRKHGATRTAYESEGPTVSYFYHIANL